MSITDIQTWQLAIDSNVRQNTWVVHELHQLDNVCWLAGVVHTMFHGWCQFPVHGPLHCHLPPCITLVSAYQTQQTHVNNNISMPLTSVMYYISSRFIKAHKTLIKR